ncbi:MAG: hypothetical protein Q4C76_00335 [Bacillota bacterium]|nr:hypothetical protein [Bacillota bacterium]
MTTTEKYRVRVTLFGTVTLENHRGRAVENPSRQSQPWLLLKYLLVHRTREVDPEELAAALWPDNPKAAGENAARVRLNRLREALTPLGLEGKSGLVQYAGGRYRLNPRYILDTDEDRFLDLLARLRGCPAEDPAGLTLCLEALTLAAGPYLGKTGDAPWAAPYRACFRRAFAGLARDTLARTRTLEDPRAVDLLCRRVPDLLPGDAAIHDELCDYLKKTGRELDLLRLTARPVPREPKPRPASQGHEIVSKIVIQKGQVYTVAAPSGQRPLQYTRRDEPELTRVFREEGLSGLLLAVAREIHRGRIRTRADSKLTRAIRKALHTLGLETFLDLEEEPAAQTLTALVLEELQGESKPNRTVSNA